MHDIIDDDDDLPLTPPVANTNNNILEGVVDVAPAGESATAATGSDSDSDSGSEEDVDDRWSNLQGLPDPNNRADDNKIDLAREAAQGFRCAMMICPSLGMTWGNLSLTKQMRVLKNAALRKAKTRSVKLPEACASGIVRPGLNKQYWILRTFESSAELFSLDSEDTSVYCDSIAPRLPRSGPPLPWDVPLAKRLSLVAHVPELSLVAVGSMDGRVALLRLTRPPAGCQPRRAFRVEHVLPRPTDEYRRLRPRACLHGLAVGPYKEPGARKLDLFHRFRRSDPFQKAWRLILHYQDHTILQYTIMQSDPDEDEVQVNLADSDDDFEMTDFSRDYQVPINRS